MKLFKKNQEEMITGKVAEKLATSLLKRQQQLAFVLNRKIQQLSIKHIRIFFIGFSVLFGAYCLYLILNAFN